MPIINNISSQNSSFVLQYGAYSDFNLFLLMVSIAIVLTIVSRFLSTRDETGRLLVAVLAVLIGVAGLWMSLGVAVLGFASGATLSNNTSGSQIVYNAIFPTQQVIASPILTIICLVILIFSVLNALDIFISIIQRAPEVSKQQGGSGFSIYGKRVRTKKEDQI